MGVFSAKSIPITQFAASLAFFVNRFVIDKTGLAGSYDIEFAWTPDQAISPDDGGASIFTALREQLGLKVVAEKARVEVLVVDHAEQPAPE